MARPARSVSRTVQVLNFMASRPGQRFTLTEIARALELNKASCHAMLIELASEGIVLRRASDKTYILGGALVNLGRAAGISSEEVLDIARAELIAIHDELGVSCVATKRRGFESVVVARRDTQRPLIDYSPVGNSALLTPPSGQEFMAWANRDVVDRWLDLSISADLSQREAYYQRLAQVRSVGYRASVLDEARALRRLLRNFTHLPGSAELIDAVGKLAFGPFELEDYEPRLAIVTRFKAPIFGPTGAVELVLTMSQLPPDLPIDELRDYVARLMKGAQSVTRSIHGFEPTPDWVSPTENVVDMPQMLSPEAS